MNAPDFLDANILIYAYDAAGHGKRETARALIRKALNGESVISTQVLAEFAAALLHKVSPRARPKDIQVILDILGPIRVVGPDQGIVRRAVEAHERYGIHFYDGMIVAAAERAGCKRIWSEDLSAGQKYFGIPVVNPFVLP